MSEEEWGEGCGGIQSAVVGCDDHVGLKTVCGARWEGVLKDDGQVAITRPGGDTEIIRSLVDQLLRDPRALVVTRDEGEV